MVLSCKGQRIESRREVSTHATNSPYKGIVGSTTWKVNLDDLPDDALALRAQEGEEDAATVLYRRCWPIARGISKERGLPEEEWDQLLVDVFLNCVAPGRFDPARGRFGAYFRAAAENEARRLHQRRRSKHRSVESLDAMVAAGHAVELDSLRQPQVLDEQGVQLRAAARSLVAEWRDARTRQRQRRLWASITEALFLDELPVAEAAVTLGTTPKSIHNCLKRHIRPAITARINGPYGSQTSTRDGAGADPAPSPTLQRNDTPPCQC